MLTLKLLEMKTAIADLCRYVKQASGVQEQLPISLKHCGDTRPWTSMFRCAESVEKCYEALVSVLMPRGTSLLLFTDCIVTFTMKGVSQTLCAVTAAPSIMLECLLDDHGTACLQIQPNKFSGDFQDTFNKVPGGFLQLIEPPKYYNMDMNTLSVMYDITKTAQKMVKWSMISNGHLFIGHSVHTMVILQ